MSLPASVSSQGAARGRSVRAMHVGGWKGGPTAGLAARSGRTRVLEYCLRAASGATAAMSARDDVQPRSELGQRVVEMNPDDSYRSKAEQIRALADSAETPGLRASLAEIADQYEVLAQQSEQQKGLPRKEQPVEAAPSAQRHTNYALSIVRDPRRSRDDPAAYAIIVTPTFLSPRAMSRLATTNPNDRERWHGVARGLDGAAGSISQCLPGTLSLRLIPRSGIIWARVTRADPAAQKSASAQPPAAKRGGTQP
jgi:hypothetical protein